MDEKLEGVKPTKKTSYRNEMLGFFCHMIRNEDISSTFNAYGASFGSDTSWSFLRPQAVVQFHVDDI